MEERADQVTKTKPTAATKDIDEEEAKETAEIEALAVEEARVAAIAKERAEIRARAAEESRTTTSARKKAKEAARAKAMENAKVRLLAHTGASVSKAKSPETPTVADIVESGHLGISVPEPEAPETKSEKKAKPSKESAKCCWYYTSEGERMGPVNFEALRKLAAGSSLDPRLDMVWRKTMDAWIPAGQIDGLFERRSVPVESKATATPKAARIRQPKSSVKAPKIGYRSWPGARRRSLLLVTLVFPFAWHFGLEAASPLLTKKLGQLTMGRILPAAAYMPLLVLVWFGMKRLVNLGMSRMWCLAVFAPVLNVWLGYRCFVCPAGYAYHKKLDGPGILLAILYWLIVLAAAVIFAAIVAQMVGAVESPALQKQLSRLIRSF